MEGRDANQPVAATYTDAGTDVNFGNLTRMLFDHLKNMDGVKIRLKHEVTDLEQLEDGNWCITLDNLATKKRNKRKSTQVLYLLVLEAVHCHYWRNLKLKKVKVLEVSL
jgi:malate dehydrogenase (quinone)